MLRNLSLKLKIIVLSALIVAGLLGLGLAAITQMQAYNAIVDDSLIKIQRRSDALADVEKASVSFRMQVQEWKNILLRGNDEALYDRYYQSFAEQEKAVQEYLQSGIRRQKEDNHEYADFEVLLNDHREMGANYREALKSFDHADPEAGKKVDNLVAGMDRAASQHMLELAEKMAEKTASLNLAWALQRYRHETGDARKAKGKTNADRTEHRSSSGSRRHGSPRQPVRHLPVGRRAYGLQSALPAAVALRTDALQSDRDGMRLCRTGHGRRPVARNLPEARRKFVESGHGR